MKLTHSNIVSVFLMATSQEFVDGTKWYLDANLIAQEIAKHGCSLEQASGVIAALSPSNKWQRNCQDAENFIRLWAAGGDPMELKVCTYGSNKKKALSILDGETGGESIEDILSGRKVSAFYRCILGKSDSVCVDGHAYSIWLGERIPTNKTPKIGKLLYESISNDYRLATELINNYTDKQLAPYQVQAVTWLAWRRIVGAR
jgi:hypothetical protein